MLSIPFVRPSERKKEEEEGEEKEEEERRRKIIRIRWMVSGRVAKCAPRHPKGVLFCQFEPHSGRWVRLAFFHF